MSYVNEFAMAHAENGKTVVFRVRHGKSKWKKRREFLRVQSHLLGQKRECVDNTLLLADEKTEGLCYAAFDMDDLRSYREREMLGNTFRKVKAYAPLLDDRVEVPFVRVY